MTKKKCKVANTKVLEETVFGNSVPKWNFDKEGQINPACTVEENET